MYDGYGSVYFDSTTVGTPVAHTLLIYNTGDGPLTLDPASVTLPSGFSLVTPFAAAVAAGGSTDCSRWKPMNGDPKRSNRGIPIRLIRLHHGTPARTE